MNTVFQGNVAVCPNCSNVFEHNKVNGIALVQAVNDVDARKRMYCRMTLDSLERLALEKKLSFDQIKKIVLDNFNDFNRDVQSIIGYGDDID